MNSHRPFRLNLHILFLIILLPPLGALANHKIVYSSYTGGKAIIHINGRMKSLYPGQTSKDGVKLLSFNKKEAIVRVHGIRFRYKKKSKTGEKLQDEIEIPFNFEYSSYFVWGHINGKSIPFVVDTGASTVALSLSEAKRLKIRLKKKNEMVVTLAGGRKAKAWSTNLDSVRVGDIEIKKVAAIIFQSKEESIALLGMSFLKELEMSNANNVMTLKYNPP